MPHFHVQDRPIYYRDAGGGALALLCALHAPEQVTAVVADSCVERLPGLQRQITSMAEQMPAARLYLANTGGHPFMWTRPGEFRRLAGEFLETVLHDEPAAERDEDDGAD